MPKIKFSISWWFTAFPIIFFSLLAFKETSLPGIYMDAVNPDYLAAWLIRGTKVIPAWIYPDNFIAGQYHFPLLNSLYGGNITAYLGLLFFTVTGFGAGEIRVYHAVLGLAVLISLSWCFSKWHLSRTATAITLCLLALDPTFLFAWRTQYYLQLVPIIFMAIGLGLLAENYQRLKNNTNAHRHLLFAGIFFGYAAYSYFIFAFYATAIIFVYIWSVRKHFSVRSISASLIGGTFIGWIPYAYAHASIILNTSFQSYLEQLRGLQTTYGVLEKSQGGLTERFFIVWERLGFLVAGRSIQISIFSEWKVDLFSFVTHVAVLSAGPLLCILFFIHCLMRKNGSTFNNYNAMQFLFIKLIIGIFIIHMTVGLIIGRPLGLQHYVMLLPVLYAMTAAGLTYLLRFFSPMHRMRSLALGITLTLYAGFITSNLSMSLEFGERLKQIGGRGMYSDAINVAAAHIKTLSQDTILLFPQWGYWMGILSMIGPQFSIYETASLDAMQVRLSHLPQLQNQQNFIMLLGSDFINNNPEEAYKKIESFSKFSQLKLGKITYCQGRNGVDQLWLVQMTGNKGS